MSVPASTTSFESLSCSSSFVDLATVEAAYAATAAAAGESLQSHRTHGSPVPPHHRRYPRVKGRAGGESKESADSSGSCRADDDDAASADALARAACDEHGQDLDALGGARPQPVVGHLPVPTAPTPPTSETTSPSDRTESLLGSDHSCRSLSASLLPPTTITRRPAPGVSDNGTRTHVEYPAGVRSGAREASEVVELPSPLIDGTLHEGASSWGVVDAHLLEDSVSSDDWANGFSTSRSFRRVSDGTTAPDPSSPDTPNAPTHPPAAGVSVPGEVLPIDPLSPNDSLAHSSCRLDELQRRWRDLPPLPLRGTSLLLLFLIGLVVGDLYLYHRLRSAVARPWGVAVAGGRGCGLRGEGHASLNSSVDGAGSDDDRDRAGKSVTLLAAKVLWVMLPHGVLLRLYLVLLAREAEARERAVEERPQEDGGASDSGAAGHRAGRQACSAADDERPVLVEIAVNVALAFCEVTLALLHELWHQWGEAEHMQPYLDFAVWGIKEGLAVSLLGSDTGVPLLTVA